MMTSHPLGGQAPTRLLIAALAALLLVACGKPEADAPGASQTAAASSDKQSSADADAAHDPCSLLEPKEVEAALGGTLVGAPYRFEKTNRHFGPAVDGDACRYEGANFHFIEVEVEWEGGAQQMNMYGTVQGLLNQNMKGTLKLADGSELAGEWDEARVVTCCTFLAMRGDQLVTVNIAGSTATLEQAGGIADAALKRIDKPLQVDTAKGVAAAIARDATRPKERDPCSLLSRAEAEAALEGPLTKDPVADGSKCTYAYTDNMPRTVMLDINWRHGFEAYRERLALTGQLTGKLGSAVRLSPTLAPEAVAPDPALSGPWEAASVSQMQFWAVKKDVLINTDGAGDYKRLEHARKLVVAAMSKL